MEVKWIFSLINYEWEPHRLYPKELPLLTIWSAHSVQDLGWTLEKTSSTHPPRHSVGPWKMYLNDKTLSTPLQLLFCSFGKVLEMNTSYEKGSHRVDVISHDLSKGFGNGS